LGNSPSRSDDHRRKYSQRIKSPSKNRADEIRQIKRQKAHRNRNKMRIQEHGNTVVAQALKNFFHIPNTDRIEVCHRFIEYRFAGAVRTEQSKIFALLDAIRYVVDRRKCTEFFGDGIKCNHIKGPCAELFTFYNRITRRQMFVSLFIRPAHIFLLMLFLFLLFLALFFNGFCRLLFHILFGVSWLSHFFPPV